MKYLLFLLIIPMCSFVKLDYNFIEQTEKLEYMYNAYEKIKKTKTNLTEYQIKEFLEEDWCLNKHYNFPKYLSISASIVESGMKTNSIGGAGELNMFQFMPSTAKEIANELGYKYYYGIDKDPIISLNMWYFYICKLKDTFNEDFSKALLAYNMGEYRLKSLSKKYNVEQIKYIIYGCKNRIAYDDKIFAKL
jgi:soluble lytic murein transglycosylase-like protein